MSHPLASIVPEKQDEARRLDAIFRDVTDWTPRLWRRVVGYGEYHYRTKAGREGDFLATGFHMRARDISLHIMPGYNEFPEIAARLGSHKRGKSCCYINSLEDVDKAALKNLIRAGLKDLAEYTEVKGS